MVSPGMLERYHKTVNRFMAFVLEFGYSISVWDDLDEVVSEWLEYMFHEGEHKTLALPPPQWSSLLPEHVPIWGSLLKLLRS